MLVKCPECELQVSDKAPACPHCGYPMKPSVKRKPRAKNNKRKTPPERVWPNQRNKKPQPSESLSGNGYGWKD